MCHLFLLSAYIIIGVNSLCSWNRHYEPESAAQNANTLNFINGKWSLDTSQGSATFNGQRYWKKQQQQNCYISTLWLYYYKDLNDEYRWLISPTFGSTAASSYAQCNASPQPADPTKCNTEWYFAPDGAPTANFNDYIPDILFYIKPGDCPQILCESVEFSSTANDDYVGTYIRDGSNDQNNQNVYIMTPAPLSPTGQYYLYFHPEVFKWIINDDYDTDCQKATHGFVLMISTTKSWGDSSNIAGGSWQFVSVVSSTQTREITCSATIPTTSPSASDSTGYPTGAPTVTSVDCTLFPNSIQCQPTAPTSPTTPSPSKAPTSPTVTWPTVPTSPTTTIATTSNVNIISCKVYWICVVIMLHNVDLTFLTFELFALQEIIKLRIK